MKNFWLRWFCLFTIVLLIQSIDIRKQAGENKNNSVSLYQEGKQSYSQGKMKRMLIEQEKPFKVSYVIQVFLKNYSDRASFCRYLCSSDSLFAYLETQSCYLSYNCPSMVLNNLLTLTAIILYGILPIAMILLGKWNFRCISHNIAIITGVIIINQVYSRFSKQFHEDMETDYDISSSEVSSENKSDSLQN